MDERIVLMFRVASVFWDAVKNACLLFPEQSKISTPRLKVFKADAERLSRWTDRPSPKVTRLMPKFWPRVQSGLEALICQHGNIQLVNLK